MPTEHNNFSSLKNAAKVIKGFLPEVKKLRQDGGPIALPIFFNKHKETEASIKRANAEIKAILTVKKGENDILDPNVLPYYWPKYTKAVTDTTIFYVPEYEVVSSAAFSRKPAALQHKKAAEYYLKLAQEYFCMSNSENIGKLMHLKLSKIESAEPCSESEFIIAGAAEAVLQAGNRNWIPIIVKETGDYQYQVVSNHFVYAVAQQAKLDLV
jgi:hypothetical protein